MAVSEEVWGWSKTAASNATADSSINWAEGQTPGSVNNSARSMMAAIAKLRDDQGGQLTTAGTSTAYTLTTNQGLDTLADGVRVHAVIDEACGASPTLNVDGLGAKPIHRNNGGALIANELRADNHVICEYDASLGASGAWVVVGGPLPPGSIIHSTVGTYAANASLTTVIPLDDTIPQNTEGDQIISVSHTPKSTNHKLRARFVGQVSRNANNYVAGAIFSDASADALVATYAVVPSADNSVMLCMEVEWSPATTSAVTISVRVGPAGSAGTVRLNGNTGGRFFGGKSAAVLTVEEIVA